MEDNKPKNVVDDWGEEVVLEPQIVDDWGEEVVLEQDLGKSASAPTGSNVADMNLPSQQERLGEFEIKQKDRVLPNSAKFIQEKRNPMQQQQFMDEKIDKAFSFMGEKDYLVGKKGSQNLQAYSEYEKVSREYKKVDEQYNKLERSLRGQKLLPASESQKLNSLNQQRLALKQKTSQSIKNLENSLLPDIDKAVERVGLENLLVKDDVTGLNKLNTRAINKLADSYSKKFGFEENSYFSQVVKNELRAQVAFKDKEKLVEPIFEKKLAAIQKEFGKEIDTKAEKNIAPIIQSEKEKINVALGEFQRELSEEATLEIEPIEQAYEQDIQAINQSIGQAAAEIQRQYEQLNVMAESGQISQEDYEAQLTQFNQQLEQLNQQENLEKASAFEEYKKTFNNVNVKYAQRFRRQRDEMLNLADKKINEEYKKAREIYADNPEYADAVKKAYADSFKEVDESLKKRVRDNYDIRYKTYSISGLAFIDRAYKQTIGSVGGTLVGFGETLGIPQLKDIGYYTQDLNILPEPKVSEWKDIFDMQNFADLTGALAGSMLPNMLVSAGVAATTGGAGLPISLQIAITSLSAFTTESAMIAGMAGDKRFSETKDPLEASKAIKSTWQSQIAQIPAYIPSALPFVKGSLSGIRSRAGRVLAGASAELGEEFITELSQNIYEEGISKGISVGEINKIFWNEVAKDNYKKPKETLIMISPVAVLGGGGQLFSSTKKTDAEMAMAQIRAYNAKEKISGLTESGQTSFLTESILGYGYDFTNVALDIMFTDGSITQQERDALIDKSAKLNEDLKKARTYNLDESESGIYSIFNSRYNDYQKQLETLDKNSPEYAVISAKVDEYKQLATNVLERKNPDFGVISYMDGTKTILSATELRDIINTSEFQEAFKNGEIAVAGTGAEASKIVNDSELALFEQQQKQKTDETDKAQQGQEAGEESVLEEPRDDRKQDEAGQESPELRPQEQAEEEVGEALVGRVFTDPFNRTFEVKGENTGILTLEDVDTGKVLRKRKSEVLSNFKEVLDEESVDTRTTIANHLPKGGELKGVTEIDVSEDGKTINYGTKNRKTRLSVEGLSAEQIKKEIEFEKRVLSRSKRDAENFDENEVRSFVGMSQKEIDDSIKMHKQSLINNEQTEKIIIPFYEKHLELLQSEESAPPVVEQTTTDIGSEVAPDVSSALKDVESTAKVLSQTPWSKIRGLFKKAAVKQDTKEERMLLEAEEITNKYGTDFKNIYFLDGESLLDKLVSKGVMGVELSSFFGLIRTFLQNDKLTGINKETFKKGFMDLENKLINPDDMSEIFESIGLSNDVYEIKQKEFFRARSQQIRNEADEYLKNKEITNDLYELALEVADAFEQGSLVNTGNIKINRSTNEFTRLSEAYHAAKADGSNPELVKAVEELLTPKTDTDAVQKQTTSKVSPQPKTEDSGKVAEGTPKAEPKKPAEESKEEVEKAIDDFAQKLADKIRSLKADGKGKAYMSIFGIEPLIAKIGTAAYNKALDIIATNVEKGTSLGKAIQKAVEYIDGIIGGKNWDRAAFYKAMNIKYSVTLSDGRKVDVEKDTSEEAAEIINGWYSPIEQKILDTKQDKLPAKEWANRLRSKEDEDAWTGVRGFLEEKGNQSVSKKELQDFIKNNRVEIVEVVKGVEDTNNWFGENDNYEKDYGVAELQITNDGDGEGGWIVWDGEKKVDYNIFDLQSAKDVADNYAENQYGAKQEQQKDTTKFSQYQLEGEKENYKEILVVIPEYEYVDSHWDGQKGIIVWVRANTRKDVDGNKVLFVEEFQSGAGQKGKKEGFVGENIFKANQKENGSWDVFKKGVFVKNVFADNELSAIKIAGYNPEFKGFPTAPFVTSTPSWVKLGIKTALKEAVAQGATKIAWTTGEQQNERYSLEKVADEVRYKKNDDGTYNIIAFKNGENVSENKSLPENKLEETLGKDVTERILNGVGEDIEGEKSLTGENLKVGGSGMKGFYDKIVPDVAKAVVKELTGKEGVVGETDINYITFGAKSDMNRFVLSNLIIDRGKEKVTGKELKKIIDEAIESDKTATEETFADGEAALDAYNNLQIKQSDTIEAYQTGSDLKLIINGDQKKYTTSTQQSIEITPELKASVEQGMPLFGQSKTEQKINKAIDEFAEKLKKRLAVKGMEGVQKMGAPVSDSEIIDMVAGLVKTMVKAGINAKKAIDTAVAKTKEILDAAGIKLDTIISEALLKAEVRNIRLKESREKAKATREANKAKIQKLAAEIVDAVGKITPKREFYKNYQSISDFKKDYLAKNPDATEKKADSEYKKQRHSDYMASVQKATEPITKSLREKVEAAKKTEQLEAAKDAMIELLSGITEALPKIGIKKVKVNDVNKLIDAIGLSNTQKSFNTQVAKAFDVIDKIVADAESEARTNAIREIRSLLDPENALYKKQKGEKIAKAKYDRKAMAEVKALLEPITDDVLQSMSLKDLDNLFNAIYDTLAEGRDRIKAVVDATKKANIEISRKLMEQVSDKEGRSKEVTGKGEILDQIKRGNIVKIGDTYYKGKDALDALEEMANVGAIGDNTIAKVIPVTPTVSKAKTGFMQGIRSMASTYLGFIYDFATDQKSLDMLEKSVYLPVVKSERDTDSLTFQAEKRKREARARIFGIDTGFVGKISKSLLGRNWKLRRAIYKTLPFKVKDVNGNEFEITADEAIYLYNVTQRAEMNIKAVGKDGIGKTVTEESLDQIYDYILSDKKLREYAAWQVEDYFSYYDTVNDVLERNGYGTIERQKMLTEEQYAAKTNPEVAKRYFDRMRKIFGDNLPEFEPYTPAQVEGSELGSLQDRDLLDKNPAQALSVLSNNVRSITAGGALQIRSAELMRADWQKGTITMITKLDLLRTLGTVFNKDFRNMLKDVYGTTYANEFRETIEDIILGNSSQPKGDAAKHIAGWSNAAAAVVMAGNVKSFLFQYLSTPNFAIAEGLFKDYVMMLADVTKMNKYRNEVKNLDWVRQRVEGDLSSIELAQLRDGKTPYEKVTGNIISKAYIAKYADVGAIINGGAPLYAVVKEKKMAEYINKGMDKKEAEAKAKDDASLVLYRRSQESQQSSKTYEMSREQKNPFVRLALVFNQVNLQYNRKAIRAARDIKNGRGNLSENIAILAYFGLLNSPVFILLSKYMKNILADDDDDEKKKRQEMAKYANDVSDGMLKGFGAMGAAASVLKNTLYDITLQMAKRKLNEEEEELYRELFELLTVEGTEPKDIKAIQPTEYFYGTFVEQFNIPISIKARQFEKFFNRATGKKDAFGQKATATEAIAAGVEFFTNVPAERMHEVYDQIADALTSKLYTPAQRLLRAANLITKYQAQMMIYEKDTEASRKAEAEKELEDLAVGEKAEGIIRKLNELKGNSDKISQYIDQLREDNKNIKAQSVMTEQGRLQLEAYGELDGAYKTKISTKVGNIINSIYTDSGRIKAAKESIAKHRKLKEEINDYYKSEYFKDELSQRISEIITNDKEKNTAIVINLIESGFTEKDITEISNIIKKKELNKISEDYSALSSSDKLKLKIYLSNKLK